MKKFIYKTFIVIILTLFNHDYSNAQQPSEAGKAVSSVKLIGTNDEPKAIPFVGVKVLSIFYTDPDAKDVNDPLSAVLKAKNYATDKYVGIGIANCKDTWVPDAAIRMMAHQKEKQYPGSIILLDEDRILPKAWKLGDCNETGTVIILGKDASIKFIKKVKNQQESKAIIAEVVKIIEDELAKTK